MKEKLDMGGGTEDAGNGLLALYRGTKYDYNRHKAVHSGLQGQFTIFDRDREIERLV